MRRIIAATLGITLFALSAPAMSAVHFITFEGTIDVGFDEGNLFGFAGGSLAGQSYTQKFVYDSDKGSHYTTADYDFLQGGTMSSGISPITSASITINGFTQESGGADNGSLYFGIFGDGTTGISVLSQETRFTPTNDFAGTSLAGVRFAFSPPLSLTTDFANPIAGTPLSTLGNSFQIALNDHAGQSTHTFAYFNPTSVTIGSEQTSGGPGTVTGGVPEPASWAMMLAGFGLVGGMMRRRGHANGSLMRGAAASSYR
jgi:hypothetical protein